MSVSAILAEKGNNVVTALPETTIAGAAELLAQHRIGALVVTDQSGSVSGIVSERDIVRAISQSGASALKAEVSSCMTSKVISSGPDESVDGLMEKMTKGKFRHLPVIEKGKLLGIISIGDVVKRKIEQAERDAEEMKRYIAG